MVRAAAEDAGVPRDEALDALQLLTDTVFGYQDHVASQVAETYARAEDAPSRSRAHVRQGMVRELLRGEATSLGPSDLLTLDYDLHVSHLVVLLPAAPEGAATRLLIDTLAVSFRCGSHVATAQQLQLHEHAVRNQLHKAEQLVGHLLQERRTELRVALRLRRLLPADGTFGSDDPDTEEKP